MWLCLCICSCTLDPFICGAPCILYIQTGEESLRPLPETPNEIENGDSVDKEKQPKQMESTAAQSFQLNLKLEFASRENRSIPAQRNENFDVQYQNVSQA